MTNTEPIPQLLPYDDFRKLETLVERHGLQVVFNTLNNIARSIAQQESFKPTTVKPSPNVTVSVRRNRLRIQPQAAKGV